MYTYCSMNKKYVERVTKMKKCFLDGFNITMWFYRSLSE